MKILPNFSNQVIITIASDIVIAALIIGSIITSQRIENQFTNNLGTNYQNTQSEDTTQALELNSLLRNFLLLNLFIILSTSAVFIYMLIKNARQLEETNQKLRSLDKLKDEFLSMASHQLKTPATGVKAYLAMLMDGDAGKLSKMQKDFTKEAYNANERELRIIEDLLNVSRIESGRLLLNNSKLELNKLIEEISGELSKVVSKNKLTLTVNKSSENLFIQGDTDKLKMVFGNLIDNARKYTNEGGKISVTIEKKGVVAEVNIKDTGIGISKDDMVKLFEKFSRIDSTKSKEVGGTGLGLYIVKKIVELHKGNIEVNSELGKGSEFVVTLPLNYDQSTNR